MKVLTFRVDGYAIMCEAVAESHRGTSVGWLGFPDVCCDVCLAEDLAAGRATITNPEEMADFADGIAVFDPYRGRGDGIRLLVGRLLAAWGNRGVANVEQLAATLETAARIGGATAARVADAIGAVFDAAHLFDVPADQYGEEVRSCRP